MNITLPRAVIEQALEALKKVKTDAGKQPPVYPWDAWRVWVDGSITSLEIALEQPTRSQKMADAGFTPRDTRLTCDECGGQFTRQILPVHKCTALEQPEQEPVTYQDTAEKCRLETVPAKGTLLHTAPPQRKPLSDDEIQAIWKKTFESGSSPNTFARAVEAAHNIKE